MRAATLGLDEPKYVVETGHRVWGGYPIELEMAELLYALVRYAKPEIVLESGTGSGRSTQAISAALVHNGKGIVYTYESQDEYLEPAREKFANSNTVVVRQGLAREDFSETPDLVFVDTGHEREVEIAYWLQHPANPLVVVHDGARAYKSFALGEGVTVFGHDGVWVGRGR